jgi:hypothetical protein
MFCNAAWSIGLSANESAGELGREHAAIRRATPTSKLATWRCPRRRRDRDRPINVRTSFLLA